MVSGARSQDSDMPNRPACFAVGFAVIGAAFGSEPTADAISALSPIRQHLRETIKARISLKPAEPTPVPESKTVDAPVMLPVVRVKERPFVQVFDQVNAALAQEERLSSHPLINTRRLKLLYPPVLDDLPMRHHDGGDRLRIDIFKISR